MNTFRELWADSIQYQSDITLRTEWVAKEYARQACKEQRKLCSHCLAADIPNGPTHNLVLNAPFPEFK